MKLHSSCLFVYLPKEEALIFDLEIPRTELEQVRVVIYAVAFQEKVLIGRLLVFCLWASKVKGGQGGKVTLNGKGGLGNHLESQYAAPCAALVCTSHCGTE